MSLVYKFNSDNEYQSYKKLNNKSMKTAKEIAQWVIDNRYPKSENEKVSDVEMYYELVESIEKLCNIPKIKNKNKKYDR